VRRLSGTDALLLAVETPSWHQHVGGVVILDPSHAPRFGFDAVRRTVAGRLDRVPKYRWRLKEVPLGLDRPVWVDDDGFDLDRHVRRTTVAAPGGRREVAELAGRIMSRQVDRRRPLWELWYVDGVVGGKAALIAKYHHCLMDGMAGAGLADQLFDLEPEPRDGPDRPGGSSGPTRPTRSGRSPGPAGAHDGTPLPSAGARPSDVGLLVQAVVPALRTPERALRYAVASARRGMAAASQMRADPVPFLGAPSTPFNGAVGPNRSLAFTSVALSDARRVARTFDVKVNDVVLALCAGSMRRYLEIAGRPPGRSLVAAVPVSTREVGDTEQTNRVANMVAALATDVDGPVDRLQAIHRNTQTAKAMTSAIRSQPIQSVGEVAPPVVLSLASRALWASNLSRLMPVTQNAVIANVPGPPFELYSCGARVTGIYSASVLMVNIGLNITVMSYEDRLDVGVTVDADLVKDPWVFADGVGIALAELLDDAGLGEARDVTDPFDS